MDLDGLVRRVIPSLVPLTYNPLFKLVVDSFDIVPRLFFGELRSIPPNHLRIRVGVGNRLFNNQVAFVTGAEKFWLYVFHSRLCGPDSTIVDIGCGCGRYAHHLRDWRFKDTCFHGRYIGIDIDREALDWCQNHFDSRFQFLQSTHASKTYKSELDGGHYSIPLPDNSADFIFSTSLLTHLLEEEIENVFTEAYRILKPGGHMLMSYFCTEYPPPGKRHQFTHTIGNAKVVSMKFPEAAVAYSKNYIDSLARSVGFHQLSMASEGPEDWQPIVTCRK